MYVLYLLRIINLLITGKDLSYEIYQLKFSEKRRFSVCDISPSLKHVLQGSLESNYD